MATEFVRVKNAETGAVASLPETALQFMTNWKRVDGPPPARPKPNRTPPPARDGDQSQQPDAADAASTEQE